MTDVTKVVPVTSPSTAIAEAQPRRDVAILIVDDEPGIRSFLQRSLAKEYGLVEAVENVEAAQELRARLRFDVLVVDISLPGRSGLEWIEGLRRDGDRAEVIFITAYADLNATIGAIRVRATDFILKPFRVEQLLASVKRCLANRAHAIEPFTARRIGAETPGRDRNEMIGRSAAMQEICRIVERVGPTPVSVLIEGETGTGKELVAHAIHRASRRPGSFVAINCVAIAPELFESELFGHTKGAFTGAHQSREGLFVAAKGGTLFLDEISEMPFPMQAKLLRALETLRVRPVGADQEIPVDVRLITATNRNLAQLVRNGSFREDLYFRLNVVNVTVPALRERAADVPELLEYFSAKLARELGVAPYAFSPEDVARLQTHAWPGNVRELRNVVERALLLGHMPAASQAGEPARAPQTESATSADFSASWKLEDVEKYHTLRVLGDAHGNKSEAARRLGISRKTLERKLAAWPDTRRPTK